MWSPILHCFVQSVSFCRRKKKMNQFFSMEKILIFHVRSGNVEFLSCGNGNMQRAESSYVNIKSIFHLYQTFFIQFKRVYLSWNSKFYMGKKGSPISKITCIHPTTKWGYTEEKLPHFRSCPNLDSRGICPRYFLG